MTIVCVLDTETSGLKADKGHRIIEIALICYQLETEKELFRFVRRINPHRAIDPMAQLIHGITQADLVGKPSFGEIEPFVTKILEKSNIAVAHNLQFDAQFINAEYSLIGKIIPNVQGFCTMDEGRAFTSLGKKPNLGELCWACGVDYDPEAAHSATYDAEVTAQCFFYGVKHGGFNIKELLNK